MTSRKLLEEEEEETENENPVEIVNEEKGQIIAFESKALDFINQQQYCGLVCLNEDDCLLETEGGCYYTCCVEERANRNCFLL